MKSVHVLACILSLTALGAQSAAAPIAAPDVPAGLRPPAGQVLSAEALATGVQIYECAAKPGDAAGYEWVFRSPEAVLGDRSGGTIGKHYAGPTWESNDGSAVSGEVASRDPGPSASAIPWLLLKAKTNSGSGVFSNVTNVQRVQTVGGIAPTEACSAANLKQLARVPYTATYYFYRAGSASAY